MRYYRAVSYMGKALLVLLLVLWGGCGCGRPARERQLNVVLVTLDTTRADRFSSYGYDKETTPNFDALAQQGVLFEMAISSAAMTPVSHASILTGLYPYQHGVRVLYAASGYELAPEVPTLATVLKEAGWTNGAVLSAFPVSEYYGFDAGFHFFDNGIEEDVDTVIRPSRKGARFVWGAGRNQRRSDVTTDVAVGWVSEVQGPFFLWIHYWDPHDWKLRPPEEIQRRFGVRSLSEEGAAEAENARFHREEDQRHALYDAEVHYIDLQFGRLVDRLRDLGRYDDTIFIVVSDHGEGLGDHGWRGHRILYQEQIHVPLILRLPGGPAGRSVSALARTIDIVPTVLDWLELDVPLMEGRTLVPLIEGEPDDRRIAYAEQINLFDKADRTVHRRPMDDLLYCAMDDQWKLTYRPRHPELSELYNLKDDPGELQNLFASERSEVNRLMAHLRRSGGFVDEPFGEGTDAEVRERLEALGYIGD